MKINKDLIIYIKFEFDAEQWHFEKEYTNSDKISKL